MKIKNVIYSRLDSNELNHNKRTKCQKHMPSRNKYKFRF